MFIKHNRYACFLCFALISLFSIVFFLECKAEKSESFDWDKLLRAWEAYLNYPSSDNADKVTALLPDTGHISYIGGKGDESEIDSVWNNLGTLEYQMYASDRSAVRLAFRLYSIADGAFAEELDIILGRLIRINARLFLEELKNNYRLALGLDGLVGNFGYEQHYGDDNLETTLRIEALKRVTNPKLKSIRDECIKALAKAS